MSRRVALLRQVSPALARCELEHLARQPIDLGAAESQHREYGALLARLGYEVRTLAAEERFPDCVFVEDTALVLPEVTVLARPGAASRRGEVEAVGAALAELRPRLPEARIDAPGTLDGGDVLRLEGDSRRRVFVGRSRRTDGDGIGQLRDHLALHGYEVVPVAVSGCLHLKTAVTQIGPGRLLANPDWLDLSPFLGLDVLAVDPAEPFAANALLVAGRVVYPRAHPRTRRRLEEGGIAVETVEVAELEKAEGGVTCCSLLFEA